MSSEKPIASKIIKEMAAIAWKARIKGKSLERNSLMMPINKVFDQIRRQQHVLDLETLRAATITEVFTYLERIHDSKSSKYKINKRETRLKVEELVNLFFHQVLRGIYQDKLARLMVDEKNIKAAYLFYVRNEITSKEDTEE
jgi:CRISPR-associated protein Csc3